MTMLRKLALLSGVLVCSPLALSGCSSSSSESTEKINGMAPGEYREKAELSREIQTPAPKTGARPQRR